MATDPVRSIRATEQESPVVPDLQAALTRLAALPPSPSGTCLTVSFDWSIDGSEPGRLPAPAPKRSQERAMRGETGAPRRPGWQQMQRELHALVESHGPRGETYDALAADLARITEFVETQLEPNVNGAFIVADGQQGVFEAIPLDVAPTPSLVLESVPALRPLVHASEDYPTFAVVNANQQEANVWVIERLGWSENIQVASDGYPRHQSTGGLNAQRYQNRANERVEAFARTVAEQVNRLFMESSSPPDYLILSDEEPMATAIAEHLHKEVSPKVLGRVVLGKDPLPTEIAAIVAPMIEAAERQEEIDAVQKVADNVGAQTLGIAGAVDTLRALANGQVQMLVMNDDFTATGWADYTLPLFGLGEIPAEHPAGGDVANLRVTKLEDEAVRLAVLNGGTVELIQTTEPLRADSDVPRAGGEIPRAAAATALDGLGGIGAVLRYDIA
ncbi:MAG: hypothetical protein JNM64_04800 [Chloroflexia bacterium]|nr:hypothetical protein [Chloroflexia bacterium]